MSTFPSQVPLAGHKRSATQFEQDNQELTDSKQGRKRPCDVHDFEGEISLPVVHPSKSSSADLHAASAKYAGYAPRPRSTTKESVALGTSYDEANNQNPIKYRDQLSSVKEKSHEFQPNLSDRFSSWDQEQLRQESRRLNHSDARRVSQQGWTGNEEGSTTYRTNTGTSVAGNTIEHGASPALIESFTATRRRE